MAGIIREHLVVEKILRLRGQKNLLSVHNKLDLFWLLVRYQITISGLVNECRCHLQNRLRLDLLLLRQLQHKIIGLRQPFNRLLLLSVFLLEPLYLKLLFLDKLLIFPYFLFLLDYLIFVSFITSSELCVIELYFDFELLAFF